MSAPAVQQMMETLMNTTYRMPHSPTLRKEHEAGLAEGRRSALFELLEARGLKPSDEQRGLAEACENLDTLKRWLGRAVTANSTDQVFG